MRGEGWDSEGRKGDSEGRRGRWVAYTRGASCKVAHQQVDTTDLFCNKRHYIFTVQYY